MERKFKVCPCLEKGTDGTTQHSKPSGRYFIKIYGDTIDLSVQPCTNHLTNYIISSSFREIIIYKDIEGEKI